MSPEEANAWNRERNLSETYKALFLNRISITDSLTKVVLLHQESEAIKDTVIAAQSTEIKYWLTTSKKQQDRIVEVEGLYESQKKKTKKWRKATFVVVPVFSISGWIIGRYGLPRVK